MSCSLEERECRYYRECVGHDGEECPLKKINTQLLQALEAAEWGDSKESWDEKRQAYVDIRVFLCPVCGRKHDNGHTPDCILAKALKKGREG